MLEHKLPHKEIILTSQKAKEVLTIMARDWRNFIATLNQAIKEYHGLSEEDKRAILRRLEGILFLSLPDCNFKEIAYAITLLDPQPFEKYINERSQKIWMVEIEKQNLGTKLIHYFKQMDDFTKTIIMKGALGNYFEQLKVLELKPLPHDIHEVKIELNIKFFPQLKTLKDPQPKSIDTDTAGLDKLLQDLSPQFTKQLEKVLTPDLEKGYQISILETFRPWHVLSAIKSISNVFQVK